MDISKLSQFLHRISPKDKQKFNIARPKPQSNANNKDKMWLDSLTAGKYPSGKMPASYKNSLFKFFNQLTPPGKGTVYEKIGREFLTKTGHIVGPKPRTIDQKGKLRSNTAYDFPVDQERIEFKGSRVHADPKHEKFSFQQIRPADEYDHIMLATFNPRHGKDKIDFYKVPHDKMNELIMKDKVQGGNIGAGHGGEKGFKGNSGRGKARQYTYSGSIEPFRQYHYATWEKEQPKILGTTIPIKKWTKTKKK